MDGPAKEPSVVIRIDVDDNPETGKATRKPSAKLDTPHGFVHWHD